MDYKAAHRRYKDTAGDQYRKPSKASSYQRNDAWHLLGESGGLLAVVHPDGSLNFGDSLRAVLEIAATRKRRA